MVTRPSWEQGKPVCAGAGPSSCLPAELQTERRAHGQTWPRLGDGDAPFPAALGPAALFQGGICLGPRSPCAPRAPSCPAISARGGTVATGPPGGLMQGAGPGRTRGLPENVEPAAIQAVLQPVFLPQGTFGLRSARAMRVEKAKATVMEFVEKINHGAIPRHPGRDGVWRVLCKESAWDTRVLRQMRRWLLYDFSPPREAAVARVSGDRSTPPALETQARGEPAVRQADLAPGAAKVARTSGHRDRNGTRGSRWTQKGKKRDCGGRPSTAGKRESEDSSEESLGLVIQEMDREGLSGDEGHSMLQAAEEEEGSTDRPYWRHVVGDTSDEETTDKDASQSESQENGDQENPEFVAIVAYTDPSAQDEVLKIASVMESWAEGQGRQETLLQVLSVMAEDTSNHVKVQEAGRQVATEVLRKANDSTCWNECVSTKTEPQTPPPKGKKAPRGPLGSWGDEEEDGGGLLELAALPETDVAEVMRGKKEKVWEGGRLIFSKGHLGEALALQAARGNRSEEADTGSEEALEGAESEESESEDPAARKPLAKRARTACRALGRAAASAPAPSGTRKAREEGSGGRGWRGGPETKTQEEAAGSKSRKERAGAGTQAEAARAQPPAGSKSARGKKTGWGRRLHPMCS
ncbi:LOW QUALITY PROTEIN: paraneoplastic antigen-like protein 8B [Dama dama]